LEKTFVQHKSDLFELANYISNEVEHKGKD